MATFEAKSISLSSGWPFGRTFAEVSTIAARRVVSSLPVTLRKVTWWSYAPSMKFPHTFVPSAQCYNESRQLVVTNKAQLKAQLTSNIT